MLTKIKILEGVAILNKEKQQEITGGNSTSIAAAGNATCRCSDGSEWNMGVYHTAEDFNFLKQACEADGGTISRTPRKNTSPYIW